jgi:biotin operon repressor
MTVFTLGQASASALGNVVVRRPRARLGLPALPRTPVRRDSVEAGTFEDTFFATPAKGETDKLLRIARRTLDAGRQLRREARAGERALTAVERRITALTAGAVRVYEEILTLARLNHGRVFPSYEHLAKATSLGRATIARALHILEDIGFLVRQRRFRRIVSEQAGPRIKQTSNVYRPTLPERVLAYLPRWMRPAPIPDEALQRGADDATDTRTMMDGLSCQDLATMLVGGALGDVLARLGAGIDRRERESQIDAATLAQCL